MWVLFYISVVLNELSTNGGACISVLLVGVATAMAEVGNMELVGAGGSGASRAGD